MGCAEFRGQADTVAGQCVEFCGANLTHFNQISRARVVEVGDGLLDRFRNLGDGNLSCLGCFHDYPPPAIVANPAKRRAAIAHGLSMNWLSKTTLGEETNNFGGASATMQ